MKKPLEVPSLALVLDTLAYHASCLMTDAPPGRASGCGIGGWVEGAPSVFVDLDIRPASENAPGGGPWGVWAQVWLAPHGEELRCYGNRCGGRAQLVKLYAPVIEWVAAYHAAKNATIATASPALAKTRAA